MAGLDWVIIAIYFAVVFGVAVWAYLQERADESPAGYSSVGATSAGSSSVHRPGDRPADAGGPEHHRPTQEDVDRDLEAETTRSRRIDLWLSIGVAVLVAFVWILFA